MASKRGKPLGQAGGTSDDSDLDDLLTSSKGGTTSDVQINLDHLTRDEGPPVKAGGGGRNSWGTPTYNSRYDAYYGPSGPCALICMHFSVFFAHRPCCGVFCTLLGIAALFYAIAFAIDPKVEVGKIRHDWTNVRSELDLKVGDIDHWCLNGGDESCRCDDPLIPADRGEYKAWTKAHRENKKVVEQYVSNPWDTETGQVDVAFLGESLVEEMDGRWLGQSDGDHLEAIAKIFRKHFKMDSEADLEGVALGIAGDTAPNILWRLLHGELPDGFDPRVWWVSLGNNDLARMQCSEEVVIMGIIRVVEEIRTRRPNAKIVIQSLLPMNDFRSGAFPNPVDYRDAFRGDMKGRFHTLGRFGGQGSGVPASYYARPLPGGKEVQGEKEEETVPNNRKDRFPGGRRLGGSSSSSQRQKDDNKRTPKWTLGARGRSPEEMSEEAQKAREKFMEKRREFMEKQLQMRMKKDKLNPVMKDHPTIKKMDPMSMFMKKSVIPLWPAIDSINAALKKFAEKHDHITFFDATSIFTERLGDSRHVLKTELISARGHPTNDGFKKWEDAVAAHLKKMLDIKEGEKRVRPVPQPAPEPAPEPAPKEVEEESEDEDPEDEESEEEEEEEESTEEESEEEADSEEEESEEEEKEETEDDEPKKVVKKATKKDEEKAKPAKKTTRTKVVKKKDEKDTHVDSEDEEDQDDDDDDDEGDDDDEADEE